MLTINIHEAKTLLSMLVDQAAKGEPFIIAKGGRPIVKVMALDAPSPEQTKRINFTAAQISVPDDFDTMVSREITSLFGGDE